MDLGGRCRSATAIAPARPHPAAPDRSPLNKILAPRRALDATAVEVDITQRPNRVSRSMQGAGVRNRAVSAARPSP
jgi:hypothetical protein